LAAEEALASTRDQLATAVADAETLRAVIAIDHAAREQAEAAAIALQAQVDAWQAKDAAESSARSSAEEQLETTRRELESARAEAETSSRELDAERDAKAEAAAAADELRARVADLETELRKARVSVVAPVHAEIDELRAVIELQEQALAAADARELRRPRAGSESTRSYSHEVHLLFALNAEGYELFERSGPAPAVGATVELSDGRTCRVLRVGPSPFPGGQEACAYLELA
jgi:chromosome segregation ATPase